MALFGFFGSKTPPAASSAPTPQKDDPDTLPPYLFQGLLPDPAQYTVSAICKNAEALKPHVSGMLAHLNAYCIDHHGHANRQRDKLLNIVRAFAPYATKDDVLNFVRNAQHDLAWELFNANPALEFTEADLVLLGNPPRPSRLHSGLLLRKARQRVQPAS